MDEDECYREIDRRERLAQNTTCFRSAYTVDEKVVFGIMATATVFETFTYQGDKHHETR